MPKIILVTVTYGARWKYLVRTLRAALDQKIDKAIVVNNASSEPLENFILQEFLQEKIELINLSSNTGSANGFKMGLAAAAAYNPDYILMLDDDNLLEAGALYRLIESHQHLSKNSGANLTVVTAYRPDHQVEVTSGLTKKYSAPHADSFLGFHFLFIPIKIYSKLYKLSGLNKDSTIVEHIKISTAPYSGLLFNPALLKIIGMPDEKYVLYADDTDFSFRVTEKGGAIWLVTKALLTDLEESWAIKRNFKSSFDALLIGSGDMRAYYAMRNQSYFEKHRRPHNVTVRGFNKIIYLFLLWLRAKILCRVPRYRLIKMAILDGENRKLGIHPSYPL